MQPGRAAFERQFQRPREITGSTSCHFFPRPVLPPVASRVSTGVLDFDRLAIDTSRVKCVWFLTVAGEIDVSQVLTTPADRFPPRSLSAAGPYRRVVNLSREFHPVDQRETNRRAKRVRHTAKHARNSRKNPGNSRNSLLAYRGPFYGELSVLSRYFTVSVRPGGIFREDQSHRARSEVNGSRRIIGSSDKPRVTRSYPRISEKMAKPEDR